MPSDDLVLNVRQIAGYTPTANAPQSGLLLMQTAGLGSAYAAIRPADLVSTALSTGGDMAIAGALAVQSVSGGTLQFSNASVNAFSAEDAIFRTLDAAFATLNGLPIATQAYVDASVAATVQTFNGRSGNVALSFYDITAAGAAPLWNPAFGGCPRAETPPPNSNSDRLATTAFVQSALASFVNGSAFVSSFNGRVGAIHLTTSDVTTAGGAVLLSPAFIGVPTAPTAQLGTNTTQLATTAFVVSTLGQLSGVYAPIDSPAFSGYATAPTAPPGTQDAQIATTSFVMNAVQESTTGVASFNGRTGIVVLTGADISAAGGALLASPTFTGTPQAPTAALNTNTTQLATCAFVLNELGGGGGVQTFNGRSGAVVLNGTDVFAAGGALLASPAFTGTPTAPTAAPATSSTQLATTAFVQTAIGVGGVTSFNGRTGAVTLAANDVSAAGGAVLASPAFTGVPTAPTAAAANSTTQLATTAFVQAAIAASGYLPLSGGILTGPLTGTTATFNVPSGQSFAINSSGNVTGVPNLLINTPAGSPRWIGGAAGGLLRWNLSLGNAIAETGANHGADFSLNRYTDAGVVIDAPIQVIRSDGTVVLGQATGTSNAGLVQVGPPASGSNVRIDLQRNNASPATRWITGSTGPSVRWHVVLGNTLSEIGGNAGSDFTIGRYNDAGVQIDNPIYVERSSGICTFSMPIVNGSDSRMKTNVEPIAGALAIVEKLQGVFYRQAKNTDGRRHLGLIAQDVKAALPEVVFDHGADPNEAALYRTSEGSPVYGIAYSNIVAVLIEAVKTLSARVAALEGARG